MAPNYAEESRDPKKIMGPATYISVIGLGVLYTFICWMLVVAYGKNGIIPGIQAQVNGDIASVFYPATDRAIGPIDIGGESLLTRAFELTIVTGSFACQLAFFNTATRYFFSMGREGVLPRQLGRTHPTHHSPYVASTLVGVFCALIIGGFLLYDSSTLGALLYLGTWVPMMGNIGILSIMALVSLAIIRTSPRRRGTSSTGSRRCVAPLLAAARHGRRRVPARSSTAPRSRAASTASVRRVDVAARRCSCSCVGIVLAQLYRRATAPATTASAATCTRTSP